MHEPRARRSGPRAAEVVAERRALDPQREGRVLPLGGASSLVVSAAAVRSRLAARAARLSASQEASSATAWPGALLVAMAIVESGRAALGTASEAMPWEMTVAVPTGPSDLQRRCGLSASAVRGALDALVSAEVLDSLSRIGDQMVLRFRADVFEDAPVLGVVDWDQVRDRLGTIRPSAALLVLRELAWRMAPEDRARARFIPASLRDLEEATGSGKGATRTALTALNRAGLVESRMRPRVDSWHRLLPAAFGEEPGTDAAGPGRRGTPVPESGRRRAPHPEARVEAQTEPGAGATDAWAARLRRADAAVVRFPLSESTLDEGRAERGQPVRDASAAIQPPVVSPTADWAIVEVNGVRFPVPAGVTPEPEQDPATGAWFLRVGPNTRYGPLRFF